MKLCLYLMESVDRKCAWLLKSNTSKHTTPPESVGSSFCTYYDKVWRGPSLFNLSLVCGDFNSALHNIDVCGCVFMHGSKWTMCLFMFSFDIYFRFLRLCVRNCYLCFNFFAQLTKGIEQNWFLAESQTMWVSSVDSLYTGGTKHYSVYKAINP